MAAGEREVTLADLPARGSLRGPNGAVACDHPLAAQAGFDVLRAGGSAADAAVAMGTVMVVVQPHYSHLGGDAFAMVYEAQDGQVTALNSSGPAPKSASADAYRALGAIPDDGALAVTIPGCVGGWWALHQAHGRLPWARLFEAAIGYARDGFAASRALAEQVAVGRQRAQPAWFFKQTFGHIEGDGGQPVRQPELAATLERIANEGGPAFYEGTLRDACLAALNGRGVEVAADEWVSPASWEAPVAVNFAGTRVHTQPPPSQGFVLAFALKRYALQLRELAAKGTELTEGAVRVRQYDSLSEAFSLRDAMAGDPRVVDFDPSFVLSIASQPLSSPEEALDPHGDTTCIVAVDSEGNGISLIQSIFAPWGSALFVPELGILFNNRMRGFSLKPGHPNELAGGKRPIHTLHSYLVTIESPELVPLQQKMGAAREPASLFAVGCAPGGMQQPQTNLQVLDGIIREGLDVQDALDRARWSFELFGKPAPDGEVFVERRSPDVLGDAFRGEGFGVTEVDSWDHRMSRSYVLVRGQAGWHAGVDLRGEGSAIVF